MAPATEHLPQVVLMAGGLGTRLGDLGHRRPKTLQPVCGRPFLDYLLVSLVAQGFCRFHLCLGHLAEQVTDHLRTHWPHLDHGFSVGDPRLGTAGRLRAERARLDEVFLLVLGDTFVDIDRPDLCAALSDDDLGVMAISDVAPDQPGEIVLTDAAIVGYDKTLTGETPWVDTGTAVLRKRALDLVPAGGPPVDLPALFRVLITRGLLAAYPSHQAAFDIGTPGRLEIFSDYVSSGANPLLTGWRPR